LDYKVFSPETYERSGSVVIFNGTVPLISHLTFESGRYNFLEICAKFNLFIVTQIYLPGLCKDDTRKSIARYIWTRHFV